MAGLCDLCNTTIGPGAKRYSASQVKTAVRNGLRPDGAAAQLMAALGQDVNTTWIPMVMADTTDWAMCRSCASRVEPFLAKRGSAPKSEPSLKTQKFYGETVEQAMDAANSAGIPEDKIQEIKVTHGVRDRTARGEGRTPSDAGQAAKKKVPPRAFSVGSSPEITHKREEGTVEVQAQTLAPKRGFLGIGNNPVFGKQVGLRLSKRRISYKVKAEVTLSYRE